MPWQSPRGLSGRRLPEALKATEAQLATLWCIPLCLHVPDDVPPETPPRWLVGGGGRERVSEVHNLWLQ